MSHVHATDDDWRPGFARRAPNYEKIRALGASWRTAGETSALMARAILKGTPHLSLPQRAVLGYYAECLNDQELREGQATCFPGAELAADQLGITTARLRQIRADLEALGYMLRVYSRTNRQAWREGTNMAPACARLPEMIAAVDRSRAAADGRLEAICAPAQDDGTDLRPGANSFSPEQSQENLGYPVRGASAARSSPASADQPRQAGAPPAPASCPDRRDSSAGENLEPPKRRADGRPADSGGEVRAPTNRRSGGRAAAKCSPGRASGAPGARPGRPVTAETVRLELRAAARLCPGVAPLVTDQLQANPLRRDPDDCLGVMAAAAELLPEAARNNRETARWAWENHGARAIAMLALAVADPIVKNPCGYFGSMASNKGAYPDLQLNFIRAQRVLDAGGDAAAAEPEPPAGNWDPSPAAKLWAAIDHRLRHTLKRGDYGAWFSQVECRGLVDGVLHLAAPTPAAVEINRGFVAKIRAAAADVGLAVDRVVVTARGAS